jgi:hypothetical protein
MTRLKPGACRLARDDANGSGLQKFEDRLGLPVAEIGLLTERPDFIPVDRVVADVALAPYDREFAALMSEPPLPAHFPL